jgi:Holliday junction resolvase-like predicted endonuclease
MAHSGELLVERALQDKGYAVHNANILFRENCKNIDLVVYSQTGAIYVQVKSSRKPASKGHVTIDGAPWRLDQLHEGQPVYNQHREHFRAAYIVIADVSDDTSPAFYIVPPRVLERAAVKRGRIWYAKPTRAGDQRKPFRKELPVSLLKRWRDRWDLLGEPLKHNP